MENIVCIVGPTASGKTRLSIELSKQLAGEVVSADSMQIYRGMDIGTATPSMEERDGVEHHMFDIVPPDENYSVSRFIEDAGRAIDEIHSRGKLPVVVGGTGLYVDALLRGTDFAAFDPVYREELSRLSPQELYQKLCVADPEAANTLHENDVKRVMRALEVCHLTGKTIAEHNLETKKAPPRYHSCIIGLTYRNRQTLYDRCDARVDQMIKDGLIDEIRALQAMGLSKDATAMQAIGYKELWGAALGEEPIEPAIEILKRSTRRLAKRQLTWFRRNPDVNWIFIDEMESFSETLHASSDFVKNCGVS